MQRLGILDTHKVVADVLSFKLEACLSSVKGITDSDSSGSESMKQLKRFGEFLERLGQLFFLCHELACEQVRQLTSMLLKNLKPCAHCVAHLRLPWGTRHWPRPQVAKAVWTILHEEGLDAIVCCPPRQSQRHGVESVAWTIVQDKGLGTIPSRRRGRFTATAICKCAVIMASLGEGLPRVYRQAGVALGFPCAPASGVQTGQPSTCKHRRAVPPLNASADATTRHHKRKRSRLSHDPLAELGV